MSRMIDTRRFAAEGRELSGTARLSDWPRADEEVLDPSAEVEYRVIGGSDASGRPRLQFEMSGEVEVECQRCLQPTRLKIGGNGQRTDLLLASNEAQLAAWDAEVEEAEVVLANEPLDLDELLEDEFLLSLPFSPMCDDPECAKRAPDGATEATEGVDAGAATETGTNNPFAMLRGKLGSTQD